MRDVVDHKCADWVNLASFFLFIFIVSNDVRMKTFVARLRQFSGQVPGKLEPLFIAVAEIKLRIAFYISIADFIADECRISEAKAFRVRSVWLSLLVSIFSRVVKHQKSLVAQKNFPHMASASNVRSCNAEISSDDDLWMFALCAQARCKVQARSDVRSQQSIYHSLNFNSFSSVQFDLMRT